jgi:hypothetical protein
MNMGKPLLQALNKLSSYQFVLYIYLGIWDFSHLLRSWDQDALVYDKPLNAYIHCIYNKVKKDNLKNRKENE